MSDLSACWMAHLPLRSPSGFTFFAGSTKRQLLAVLRRERQVARAFAIRHQVLVFAGEMLAVGADLDEQRRVIRVHRHGDRVVRHALDVEEIPTRAVQQSELAPLFTPCPSLRS